MKTWLTTLILSLSTLGLAHADVATTQQNLKKNFPEIPVSAVNTTPVKGVYEVITEGQIVYTNDDAQYFFVGNLVDPKNQRNLTAERMQQLNKIDVSTLPLNQAIKHVKGNGKRTLYIFSDPDCPYCQRLEKELTAVDNVTIYLFLFPLTTLHPNAETIATQIWCSKNQYQAWQDYLLNHKAPTASQKCSTPIQKNLALGQKLNINGTPTMYLKNGERIAGAVQASQLNTLLDQAQ